MLSVLSFVPMMLVSAPLEWRCWPDLYQDGYSCDCGCGVVDPDCRFDEPDALLDFAACTTNYCGADQVPLQGAPGLCAPNTCGDGFVSKGESCDDGDGEGCDDQCLFVTPGYRCSALGGGCSQPVCGDRTVDRDRGESCDDGNDDAGDGCDQCAAEVGWVCRLFGACTPTFCGDQLIEFDWDTQTGENCEDFNNVAGDGCDEHCRSEPGWICNWEGCRPVVCGDGIVARGDFGSGETCDDRNTEPGDGCDGQCQIEPGWYCDDFSGCIEVRCGDLTISPGEMCDDGNTDDGDGCGSFCQTEPGWTCRYTPGACTRVECGNGLIESDDTGSYFEQCDDANVADGDGCSAFCQREPGYACFDDGTCRLIVCGDGYVDNEFGGGGPGPRPVDGAADKVIIGPGDPGEGGPKSETCDDRNVEAGDGCDAECHVEDGWFCKVPGEACVHPECGDGKVEGNEQCDDHDTDDGDGCSSACAREAGYVCKVAGEACEPLPTPWLCSQYVYGAGDGCDCGCGATDPDCPTPADLGDCQYNHCLEDAPWPTAADPSQCGTVAPPVEEDPEVVEPEPEVEEAGPEVTEVEDIAEEVAETEAVAEAEVVRPTKSDDGCAGGAGLEWLGLLGLTAGLRRRRG